MTDLLQHVSADRVVLVLFLAGTLFEKFKATRASLRDQGKRLGAIETRVTALEASGKRG
jgi:hypothetical protein